MNGTVRRIGECEGERRRNGGGRAVELVLRRGGALLSVPLTYLPTLPAYLASYPPGGLKLRPTHCRTAAARIADSPK